MYTQNHFGPPILGTSERRHRPGEAFGRRSCKFRPLPSNLSEGAWTAGIMGDSGPSIGAPENAVRIT